MTDCINPNFANLILEKPKGISCTYDSNSPLMYDFANHFRNWFRRPFVPKKMKAVFEDIWNSLEVIQDGGDFYDAQNFATWIYKYKGRTIKIECVQDPQIFFGRIYHIRDVTDL